MFRWETRSSWKAYCYSKSIKHSCLTSTKKKKTVGRDINKKWNHADASEEGGSKQPCRQLIFEFFLFTSVNLKVFIPNRMDGKTVGASFMTDWQNGLSFIVSLENKEFGYIISKTKKKNSINQNTWARPVF